MISKNKREKAVRTIARNSAIYLSVAVTIAGCSVGPTYKRPTVNIPPYHNGPDVLAMKGNVAPQLDSWWLGFNDSMLTTMIERSLSQNLDLAASYARIEQARAVARQASARRKPNVSLAGDDTTLRQSLESPVGRYSELFPDFHRNQNYFELGVASTWEADLFGGARRAATAAHFEAEAAEANRLGVRVSVVAETADAYFQIRGAQMRLAYVKDQIATDEHLVQLVSQRVSAGIASDRELAQAEALLFEARASVFPLQSLLEAQLNRVDVLLGASPGTYAQELTKSTDIPVVPNIADSLDPGTLLRRRPDLIAAERKLGASNERIGQAIAGYYPTISLSALIGNQSINPAGLFLEKGFQPTAVAGLRWRLFDFGRVDAEVRLAKGANAEALIEYRSAVLRATEEVEDSFSQLIQFQLRCQQLTEQITALQRVRDRSNEAYAAGVIALTDVLDADRQLLTARDQLAQSREIAARSAVSSFRSLGGGWTR